MSIFHVLCNWFGRECGNKINPSRSVDGVPGLRNQSGAGVLEVIIVAGVAIPLALSGVQLALMYNAKSVLNNATFEAARVGAVENAKADPMKEALARNLMPLYGGGVEVEKLGLSYGKAKQDLARPATGNDDSGAGLTLQVLSPTQQAFEDFGYDEPGGHRAIPVSHLKYRDRSVGDASGVNIQDANLLKIKVKYGYRLFVPLVNKMIGQAMAIADPVNKAYYLSDPPRLPIEATATVRMQSEAYLANHNASYEPDGGSSTVPGSSGGGGIPPANPDPDAGGGPGPEIDLPISGGTNPTKPDSFWNPKARCFGSNCNPGNPFSCAANDSTSSVNTAPGQSVGNPINVTTGDKYQREEDIPLLSGPVGIQFTRHYNSRTGYRGVLGSGWSHTYDVVLRRMGEEANQSVVIQQSDGRYVTFDYRADGIYDGRMASDGRVETFDAGFRWIWRSGRELQFDMNGRLLKVLEGSSSAVTLSYDAQYRLVQVADTTGRSLGLAYYSNGRLESIKDSAGQIIRYRYDLAGNLASVAYADNTERQYHYEDARFAHYLTGLTDGRGVRYATWAYDEQGRAVLSTHADGAGQVSLRFEDDVTYVTNSEGVQSTYYWKQDKGLTLVTRIDGPGCSTCGTGDVEYEYGPNAQLAGIKHKSQPSKRYKYDAQRRLVRIDEDSQPEGNTRPVAEYVYRDHETQPSVIIEPSVYLNKKHAWFLSYDQAGQIVDITETGWTSDFKGGYLGLMRSTHFEYTAGRLSAVDGPVPGAADRISFEYDAYGRSTEVRYPNGRHEKVLAYDAASRVLRRSALSGVITAYEYDARGRTTRMVLDAEGAAPRTMSLSYDAAGHITEIVGPDGKRARAEYDAAGRPTAIIGADGRRMEWRLDTEDRVTQQRSVSAAGTPLDELRYVYDPRGALSQVSNGQRALQQFKHDDAGNVSTSMDTLQRPVNFEYDTAGRLTQRTLADGVTERYAYDSAGKMVQFTDARGNESKQEFDDFGHRLYAQTPDGGAVVFRYNARGQVLARVDESGIITRYDYDDQGRLTGMGLFHETAGIRYEHVDGRLASLTSPSQQMHFAYDSKDRVIEQRIKLKDVAREHVTKYGYDEQGRLKTKTLADGQQLVYHYHAATGTLSDITRARWFRDEAMARLGLDEAGRLQTLRYGNGTQVDVGYDTQGQLTTLRSGGLDLRRYEYDVMGKLIGEQTPINRSHYSYDRLDRLVKAEEGPKQIAWGYDAVGNRLSEHRDGNVTEYRYAPDSNRLLRAANDDYQYTPTGAPVTKGVLRYKYGAGTRPIEVYRGEKLLAQYRYNVNGERITKIDHTTSPVNVTHYLYEAGQLSAELDAQGQVLAQYLYLGHRPLAKLEGEQVYALISDQRFAPIAATDAQGRTVWQAQYSAFGEGAINDDVDGDGNTFALNLRLPGQYYDHETGTHYNLHRDYDPKTGRYLTADPLGIAAGANMYAYVKNDPLNRIDPTGLYDEMVHYYMTYFLAVAAGIPEKNALIMAMAAQYIDENPLTRPLNLKWKTWFGGDPPINSFTWDAWGAYHFVLDYNSGAHGDVKTDNPLTRFKNPSSQQLAKLWAAAMRYDTDQCQGPNPDTAVEKRFIKAQLYGEYLHAFEDTFAHRDRNNKPYDRVNWAENNPAGGFGHGLAGHYPDHTYNDGYWQSTGPVADSENVFVAWKYNELRTLQMEKEVFELFKRDFATEIAENPNAKPITWQDLAGTGQAPIGVAGKPGYVPSPDIKSTLQQFNAEKNKDTKVAVLNKWLEDNGFKTIPEYDKEKFAPEAKYERDRFLRGFDPKDPRFAGVMLPGLQP